MSISKLAKQILPADSSNYTAGRARYSAIKEITVHHMAGDMSVERLAELWQNPTRDGSSHYGVNGSDIACYVSEGDIAWTNGNWESNCRAVTIEVANTAGAPDWPIGDESFDSVIRLVADIAKRNNLGVLVVGENLTMHKQYAATACPGPYLEDRFAVIAERANSINADEQLTLQEEFRGLREVVDSLQAKMQELILTIEKIFESHTVGNIW